MVKYLGGMNESQSSPGGSYDPHSSVTLLLFAIGLIVALMLAWLGRAILLLLFASIVVAVVMTAMVDYLKTKAKLRQGVAFVLILIGAVCISGLTLWLIGPSIIGQFANLQRDIPQSVHQLLSRVNGYAWGRWVLTQWSGYSQLASSVSFTLTRIGGIMLSTATVLSGIALVGFIGLYLAAEPEIYFSYLQRATPRAYRATLNACAVSAVRNLRWWVLSQMLSMAAVGIMIAIGLWALGIPLAATLGIIAALLTFIPNVGPALSVVPAVLLAVAISPTKGFLTVLLFLSVHFLEGNVITPLLERKIARLPPALTMSAQLSMAVIAGPLGLALAAPLAAAALGIFDVLLPEDANGCAETLNGQE